MLRISANIMNHNTLSSSISELSRRSVKRPKFAFIALPLLCLLPACATPTALTSTEIVSAASPAIEGMGITPPVDSSEPSGVFHLGQKEAAENPIQPAVLTIDSANPPSRSPIIPLSHQTVVSATGAPSVHPGRTTTGSCSGPPFHGRPLS